MSDSLVYVGKITELNSIKGADFIVSATVVCGPGGKWKGIVKKTDFEVGSLCIVFLPDSLIPPRDDMKFMESSGWRVKMRRFKGAPSEVVIIPYPFENLCLNVGCDITFDYKVTKYHKPVPAHLQGIAKGNFPDFIPKTDEPNYQIEPELLEKLTGLPYYVTEKADGSSTTAYRYKGVFGLCSRNLELERNDDNGYWKIANKYHLDGRLPEGIAVQWETCGPRIQSNPMGLSELEGFVFSAYNIPEHRYLEFSELKDLCKLLQMPICSIGLLGTCFDPNEIVVPLMGEGLYPNGKQREGVVVRSQYNIDNGKPISFKVINLSYER